MLRWTDLNDSGTDHTLAIDDLSVSVAVVTDVPPTVTSTVPDTDATGVLVDANITVEFSEPVTLGAGWYTINCGTSGAHPATVNETADPVIVLDPADDFAYSETCTVTLEADFIADEDAPADNMASDYSWSFTTSSLDADPSVKSTTPGTGATGVAGDANIDIEFSEPVTITPDSFFDVSCSISGDHDGATSGGTTIYTFNPTADFLPGETCTATVQNDQVLDQDLPAQPMAADYVWNFTIAAATNVCGTPYIPIHNIQGSGLVSPLNGQSVVTEGLVTASFQTSPTDLNGFFIQAIPGTEDADVLTSEGVFVYHNTLAPAVGDIVRVQATVGAYQNQTQLTSPVIQSTCSSDNALPAAIELDLPEIPDAAFSLEPYEGMLVTIDEDLTVQQNYYQGRYGQVTLGAGGRIPQIHNVTKYTGTDPYYQFTRMIVLDDASSGQNPSSIPYYANDDYMRAGDTITGGITGILDQGPINSTVRDYLPYNWYRVQPTAAITADQITKANPRPVTPPEVGGRLKIVGTNVLNYFPTLDMAPYSSTYPYDGESNTPRGADSAAEFTRQQDKLVEALGAENADVYTLMEIESWDGAADGIGAPQALCDALNTYLGTPGLYAPVADPIAGEFDPGEGGDYIQTAIIYKTTTVIPVGLAQSSNDTIFDRSPFAQEFEEIATGEQFIVVANHFKSKGSCPTAVGDPNADQGDGQGCWNLKRQQQSAALLTLINDTLVGLDPDVFVMGDLNAYGAEDPITVLTTGGLVNQIAANVPEAERYSYVFDGTAGYLDHALSTASATAQITDVAFWHINADEPTVIDYNTEYKGSGLSPDLYQAHPYRSSDHDPVIIGLNLGLQVTDLDLHQSTVETAAKPWTLVPGSYATGFTMALDPAIEYYYLDTDTIVSVNAPLADGYYEFFVDTTPAGFLDYWAAKGVYEGCTGEWEPYMWQIISGDDPIFLLKVVGTDYTLLDGLVYLMSNGALEKPLKINGDYLPGAYTFSGIVADAFGFTDDVSVDITFVEPLAVTNFDLFQSTDQAAWAAVPGSFADGFTLALDPAVEYYFLDTNTLTANRTVADGLYPFFISSYPEGFFEYWADKGVDGVWDGTESWQIPMWEIINGRAPIFQLQVSGTTYTLIDGLQGAPNLLRINGSYWPGAYTFSGEVADEFGYTDAFSVDIIFNDVPYATDQTVTTAEDTALAITLAGVDLFPGTLTYAVVDGPAHGTLSGTAPALTYTPDTDFNGTDSFTFKVNDGSLDSNIATITITVNPVNDTPVAVDDEYSTARNTALTIAAPGVLANDSDIDGDPMQVALVAGPANGELILNADGSFTYTPEDGFVGDVSFTYMLVTTPGEPQIQGWTDEAVVTIHVTENRLFIFLPIITR